jgi:hypothetical protein
MNTPKWIAGVVILAAWFARDFSCGLFRTFVLGHSAAQQMGETEGDE